MDFFLIPCGEKIFTLTPKISHTLCGQDDKKSLFDNKGMC